MYLQFANYYDSLTFDIDYEFYGQTIIKILKKQGIESGQLLEIACGTGNLTRQLSGQDFNILAFDNSPDMLNLAYPKLADVDNVTLVMQDMFSFDYARYQFDGVVMLLDVVNYVQDKKDLGTLFTNIYKGLKPGGLFIFDINSKHKLFEVLGNNTYVYEKDNIFYTWENERQGDFVSFYLNFFIKENGLYQRFEERQLERYYSIDTIKDLLLASGFKDIDYIDEDTALEITETSQRILFSAKKI